jgi:glycerol uptake facilitator-like aquaporin
MEAEGPNRVPEPRPLVSWRRALVALERRATNFDDPRLEWRRLFSELLGTFFLVTVGAGGAVVNATSHGSISRTAAVAAPGLMVTVGLVSTILGTASRAQNIGPLSAVAVGGYIILAGLWASPISGASMNPARSFGPDLVLANFTHYWVYVVGPMAGAVIAVGFAWILRGRGGDVGGLAAARGALDERVQDARQQDAAGGPEPQA